MFFTVFREAERTGLSWTVSAFAIFMTWPLQLFNCNLLHLTETCLHNYDMEITEVTQVSTTSRYNDQNIYVENGFQIKVTKKNPWHLTLIYF